MHDKDIKFLEDSFKKYYFEHFDLIHTPKNPEMREFGFQKFSSGMNRHISLRSDKELHLLLMKNIPSDVYCSNARYSFPNLPMAEKDWQNADLIFDIDAKDLHLPCRHEHTIKKCNSCGQIGNSDCCVKCNSIKFDTVSIFCNNCIIGAKKELNKLISILTKDLGIPRQNITVYFSGNEGFHIHVTSQYESLDSRHRSELVDYLTFRGAIPETFGARTNFSRSEFPDLEEKGWLGRVSREIFGAKSNKSKISKQLISDGYFSFKKKIESFQTELGVKIDPNVTVDVHRIFRLGGTINSKSGLTKMIITDIDKFNPSSEACFIDDTSISVTANCPVSFRLKNKNFGPYHNEQVTLPKYAAVYLICKGCASVS